MNKENTLKPCPFCGSNAIYLQDMRFEQKSEQFPKWYVECKGCKIRTSVATIPVVQKQWNRRIE